MLESTLATLERGANLSFAEMTEVMDRIMAGDVSEDEIARFLSALHRKGETVDEVAGAASVLRQRMTRIRSSQPVLLDTCGTGGDGSRTFNISTAAAIVTAAAGVPVAKHGNRGITSRSGSADVLAALGVNVEADVPCVEACLEELGICFCFAPLMHQAMRHVAAARRSLPHPTVFNILGPLANPAGAPFQVLGVGRAPLRRLMAEVLGKLGTHRAVVVHGSDGLDEVTLAGPTHVSEVTPTGICEHTWSPDEFGLPVSDRTELLVEDSQQSAAIIRRVLAGSAGPARDIVLANAAAALWTAGRAESLGAGVSLAAAALDSGHARALLERLVQASEHPVKGFQRDLGGLPPTAKSC
ncbi:MAG: anthranilate phosphoribosyltransferase [Planctomycetota bacterium]